VFSALPCARAIPDTPEESLAAYVVRLRGGCCLRPFCRGSASSACVTGLRLGSLALRPVHSLFPGFDGGLTTLRRRESYMCGRPFTWWVSFLPRGTHRFARRTQSS